MRIGIDLGGTKIEGIVMGPGSGILERRRIPTPRDDYPGQIDAIGRLVRELESAVGRRGLPVGVGHPGAVSRATGRLKNANSICLNGRPLAADLESALGRPIRMANDADCLAVSEHADGAAAGARCVFAVILGTGVGGGVVIDGKLLAGPNAIAGEWGHNPLP
ncbi:MAG: ROK family protein, partial [Panacagrimonas sp.]